MNNDTERVEIIEATHDAADKFGWLDGSTEIVLTQEQLTALQDGKAIAFTVCEEYVVYLTFLNPLKP